MSEHHFRVNYNNGLKLSSIGLGSYTGAPDVKDDTKLFGAVIDSVLSGGVNHIDTAVNYRYMKAERTIGAALRYLFTNTGIKRDELFIASKIGYVPGDGDRGISEDQYIEKLVSTGLVKKEDIVLDCHCMHPAFLEQQLQSSLRHLGLETVDLMYIHNPAESQLPHLG